MAAFAKEALGESGTIYSPEAFLRYIDFTGYHSDLYPSIPAGAVNAGAAAHYYRERAAQLYRIGMHALSELQGAAREALKEVEQFGLFAEVSKSHQPHFASLAGKWGLTQETAHTTPGRAEYFHVQRDWEAKLWENLGLQAPKLEEPSAASAEVLVHCSFDAKELPSPYGRIFGLVCYTALDWLTDLQHGKCLACGFYMGWDAPLPQRRPNEAEHSAQRITRRFCSDPCRQAAYRRRSLLRSNSLR